MITPEQAKEALSKLTPEALQQYKELVPHIMLYNPAPAPVEATVSEQPSEEPAAPASPTTLEQLAASIQELKEKLGATPVAPPKVEAQPAIPVSNGIPKLPTTMQDVNALLQQYPLVSSSSN